MRKPQFFLLSLVTICLFLVSFGRPVYEPKIWAVVVGISSYKDPAIDKLKFAVNDAKAFGEFLESTRAGSIPQERIRLFTDEKATRTDILEALDEVARMASKDDMIIFYFSGHGKTAGKKNDGYFLTYETTDARIAGTGLKMSDVKDLIDGSAAKMKVCYVDACHAGLFKAANTKGNSMINDGIAKDYLELFSEADKGNVAFLSSTSNEQSLEIPELGMGAFTHYLVQGLEGEADRFQKGTAGYNNNIVTVDELKAYVAEKVRAQTGGKQNPSFAESGYDKDFPLSVLKGNINLSREMGKRPELKAGSSMPGTSNQPSEPSPTKELSYGLCVDNSNYTYSNVIFINKVKEPIMLYSIPDNWPRSETDRYDLMPVGKKSNPIRVWVGSIRNKELTPGSKSQNFFFRTVDETKPIRSGKISVLLEACKEMTVEIDDKLVLLQNGPYKDR